MHHLLHIILATSGVALALVAAPPHDVTGLDRRAAGTRYFFNMLPLSARPNEKYVEFGSTVRVRIGDEHASPDYKLHFHTGMSKSFVASSLTDPDGLNGQMILPIDPAEAGCPQTWHFGPALPGGVEITVRPVSKSLLLETSALGATERSFVASKSPFELGATVGLSSVFRMERKSIGDGVLGMTPSGASELVAAMGWPSTTQFMWSTASRTMAIGEFEDPNWIHWLDAQPRAGFDYWVVPGEDSEGRKNTNIGDVVFNSGDHRTTLPSKFLDALWNAWPDAHKYEVPGRGVTLVRCDPEIWEELPEVDIELGGKTFGLHGAELIGPPVAPPDDPSGYSEWCVPLVDEVGEDGYSVLGNRWMTSHAMIIDPNPERRRVGICNHITIPPPFRVE